MKSIMGLVRPARGTVAFGGHKITGWEPFRIARQGLGYVPEDRRVFSELTVLENLEVGRQRLRAGAPEWTHEKLFEIFPNLADLRDRPAGRMSGGEQQMLTIARTLMGNPSAVLLDEPSEGLAPVIVEQMASTIVDLKKEGLAILLSEQNLHFSTLVSDRAYIIEKGQIRYEGTMAALSRGRSGSRSLPFGLNAQSLSRHPFAAAREYDDEGEDQENRGRGGRYPDRDWAKGSTRRRDVRPPAP